jgi:predicted alpha/beta hydrolase family esterase
MASTVKKQVIILHGSYGTPTGNWLPWLAKHVQSYGYSIALPTFPTPVGQSITAWKQAFHAQVGRLTPDAIVVGHSMGAGFALCLLEESEHPILGTFLASGFIGALGLPDYDRVNASFFASPFDWQTIRKLAGYVRVYAGDDDPYVPLEHTNEIARQLATPLIIIQGGAHLNEETHFVTFPQLLEDIKPLLAL